MRHMTLDEVAAILSHQSRFQFVSPLTSSIQGFSVDSRTLKPGELYFALKGERVEGHSFLQEVKQKGAMGAVVSHSFQMNQSIQEELKGFPLLSVEDPLHSLQYLAQFVLSQHSPRIVAITGSLGKTTTKELTRTLLAAKYHVSATPGNHNSQIGIPLAILNHTSGKEEILIVEMGMTLPGQIARLVQIAPPEVAVITTATLVHACNFDSLKDIAQSKGEIFSNPNTRLGILNAEMPYFSDIESIGAFPKVAFSTHPPDTNSKADFHLSLDNILHSRQDSFSLSLEAMPLPGKHNLHNLLAAIAVARYFNVEWDLIRQTLPNLSLPERRLQFVKKNGILFLNDSYNAAELSVKAALEVLPKPEGKGQKIAVLGSMMELGKFSSDCHRRVGEFALGHVERVYCLGEECLPIADVWRKEGRPVELFRDRTDLAARLKRELKENDVVLLKGSRSKELWKILEEFN